MFNGPHQQRHQWHDRWWKCHWWEWWEKQKKKTKKEQQTFCTSKSNVARIDSSHDDGNKTTPRKQLHPSVEVGGPPWQWSRFVACCWKIHGHCHGHSSSTEPQRHGGAFDMLRVVGVDLSLVVADHRRQWCQWQTSVSGHCVTKFATVCPWFYLPAAAIVLECPHRVLSVHAPSASKRRTSLARHGGGRKHHAAFDSQEQWSIGVEQLDCQKSRRETRASVFEWRQQHEQGNEGGQQEQQQQQQQEQQQQQQQHWYKEGKQPHSTKPFQKQHRYFSQCT